MRFVHLVEALSTVLQQQGLVPLLAGSSADPTYAQTVKDQLRHACPRAILVDSFLSPTALAAIFGYSVLNFHPCAYDAYGMTIVEAAAMGVPSVVAAGGTVGAVAIIGEDASIQVEMPFNTTATMVDENSNINNKHDYLPEESLDQLKRTLEMDPTELERLGQLAQTRALAWNEFAYGAALLRHLQNAVDKKQESN